VTTFLQSRANTRRRLTAWPQRQCNAFAIISKWRPLQAFVTLILASLGGAASAFPLSPDVEYGAVYNDGALHLVPPNIVADDPIVVQGTSQVGVFLASTAQLRVQNAGRIDVDENSIGDALGVYATQDSAIEILPGGRIDIVEASTGVAAGIVVENNSTLDFGGVLSITEDGNGDLLGVQAVQSTFVRFSGSASAIEEGNGALSGIVVGDLARLEFDGSLDLTETGNGLGRAFLVFGDAQLDYGGTIYMRENNNQGSGFAAVTGHGVVNFESGEFTIEDTGPGAALPLVMLQATDQALIRIVGGTFRAINEGVNTTPGVQLALQSQLRIRGSNFNYPFGAVPDASGLVTGILADGQPFAFQFARTSEATLILVPEPSAACLAIVGMLLAAAMQRLNSFRDFPTRLTIR
jgi:hypothetical protein